MPTTVLRIFLARLSFPITLMKPAILPILFGSLLLTGCHSISQQGGADRFSYRDPATGIQVERGRPNAVVDGIGWVAGIPNKLAIWDSRADNHDVSPKTERAVARYAKRRGLNGTLLRVNQYDPIGEWERLTANDRVSPGWRYTFGTYNHLKYVLVPGRIFGGDWYNPYTDTTHIYSDIAPLAISRTAYGKDIREQDLPGTYAVTQEIPFVSLISTTKANTETLAYTKQYGSTAEIAEAQRVLAPDYGGSWGGQLASFVPFGAPLGRLAGAAVGHATNKVRGQSTATGGGHGCAQGDCDELGHCDEIGHCDTIGCDDSCCDGLVCDGPGCGTTECDPVAEN